MSSSKTTVLITGANRGIGKGLLTAYLLRPNHVVVAAVRDPSHVTAQSLSSLTVGDGSSLIVVEYDASSDTSVAQAVKTLEARDSITTLNVVVANAAMGGEITGPPLHTSLQVARDYYNTNAVGPLALFQATFPLLSAAVKTGSTPRFVTVTSPVGSIGSMEHIPSISAEYGPSKAALNWITRRIHFDYSEIIAFPINPGFVATDTGNSAARNLGMEEAPVTIKDCANFIVSVIDKATREETSGKYMSYDDGLTW